MSLRKKQSQFALNVAFLILESEKMGYEVTFGEAWRNPKIEYPYSHPESTHFYRLAIDLNLFKDGRYIEDDEGHRELHKFWEECGGSKMIEDDPNHYSYEYQGVR